MYEKQIQNTVDFSEIGVFLFEPGNSGGIVKLPPNNLVAALNRQCKKNNISIRNVLNSGTRSLLQNMQDSGRL